MFLTLSFRNEDGSRDGGPEVVLKAAFVWFEGPDDLHIQFGRVGSDNFCPTIKDGEYFAPHPETGEPAPLYSLMINSTFGKGNVLAPRSYRKKIEAYWESPNRC